MIEQSFGAWLQNKRGDLSLRTFARIIGVDAGTLSRTERGCTLVLVPTAVRICLGLGLDVASFFQDWQGRSFVSASQLQETQWQGALTRQDVERWLLRILVSHQRNREMLISALNLIVGSGLLTKARALPLFALADLEKMLLDHPWLSYEVPPPLLCSSIDVMWIYQHAGLVLPSEVGAMVRMLRTKSGFSLKQLSEMGISTSALSNIENGRVKRVRLLDLIHLDESLQCNGALIALYWWEVSNHQMLEQEWNATCSPYSLEVMHRLVSLLIGVGRALQVIYQEDTIWHRTIRYELGL